MFGLQLSHAVRVEEVIERDAEQVVKRVAQVSLSAGNITSLSLPSDVTLILYFVIAVDN